MRSANYNGTVMHACCEAEKFVHLTNNFILLRPCAHAISLL